ncbi:WhiB family transcriptional regulator [Rhodococcus sp. NPDC060176]|uniref:WhiB family transcriptional regulator n=1 Tax=Rhodococcus sp. NPDC060176 TaxID=3347062 RepID=UPI00365474ED
MPPTKIPSLRPLAADWDWQLLAECRFVSSNIFFPEEGETRSARLRRERAAKDVCAGCIVRLQCREHAFGVGEQYGVWGGTSEIDRRAKIAGKRVTQDSTEICSTRAQLNSPFTVSQGESSERLSAICSLEDLGSSSRHTEHGSATAEARITPEGAASAPRTRLTIRPTCKPPGRWARSTKEHSPQEFLINI